MTRNPRHWLRKALFAGIFMAAGGGASASAFGSADPHRPNAVAHRWVRPDRARASDREPDFRRSPQSQRRLLGRKVEYVVARRSVESPTCRAPSTSGSSPRTRSTSFSVPTARRRSSPRWASRSAITRCSSRTRSASRSLPPMNGIFPHDRRCGFDQHVAGQSPRCLCQRRSSAEDDSDRREQVSLGGRHGARDGKSRQSAWPRSGRVP